MKLNRQEKEIVQRKFCTYCIKVLHGEALNYPVMGRQVPVRDEWICKALKKLPIKKREIILMLYFLDMTEKEIADCLKLVQSTIHYHKDDSLRLLRKLME